ncbi:DUF5018-related domain-containing protein [Saccharicrinis aurantiacus]|uniref:DUF5018-related domain-containing protein n=1 Tax=Saccharicrinis aurantiacus TaxID=1849719 RepID=UPI0008395B69|nr:hypothetical protein [Saccharicrinis aurantiacus]
MKTLKYISAALLLILFSSCLKLGLDDIEYFDEADITAFNFEYRWMGDNNGNDRLFVQKLNTAYTIDTIAYTISCDITVPDASDTGDEPTDDFPTEIRDMVSIEELVGYADLSAAAKIAPIGSAPNLGSMQNFSGSDMQYKVTAADDKTIKEWTLIITSFTK